jgi:hypothetical protein
MRPSRLRSSRCQRCCIAHWINREAFLATCGRVQSPYRPILGRRKACGLGEKTKNSRPTISLRLRDALCGPTNYQSQSAQIAGGRRVFARYRMPNLVLRQMDGMISVPMLLEPVHQFVRH